MALYLLFDFDLISLSVRTMSLYLAPANLKYAILGYHD